ncbi:hypothetical protein [Streptomyces sp. NBC_01092]|uniref:hypothetical protein n=1 Tax=Streptomyces sp. NBC_01092 TaxID=2903748 RepID=UPI0038637CAD|nr:hypothetical protein OG254_49060 [Streptomyces sp. NBC_01092]
MLLKALSSRVQEASFEDMGPQGLEFFGLDTRRYGPGSLWTRLERMGVSVLAAVTDAEVAGFAGYRINSANHRQAEISVCAFAPDRSGAILDALIRQLSMVRRVGSFVAVLVAGSADVPVYLDRGFVNVGRLRASKYRDYRYHDDEVLHLSIPKTEGEVDSDVDAEIGRSRHPAASPGI